LPLWPDSRLRLQVVGEGRFDPAHDEHHPDDDDREPDGADEQAPASLFHQVRGHRIGARAALGAAGQDAEVFLSGPCRG